ncbi:MAG: MOSC N-terminal beta barrel domain-containing protein [Deltaproteobacteria bacterium]|nr:MOSC N-terminal beta barrel domain-containing protein [Deltaproteobacteria bacterium]
MGAEVISRQQIGVIGALWRYPVKSMRGESLSVAEITQRGVAGDRTWALRESTYGGLVSARTWPAMLQLRSSWADDPVSNPGARVRIDLPNGEFTHASDPDAAHILSDFLRREVCPEPVRITPITPEEREAIMRGDAMPPARDYFDEDVIHLIATGTLAHLRTLSGGDSDFDPRRFRANIVVDTGVNADSFVEDGWLDGSVEIGESVRIIGMRPALRCAITTHPQDELPHDAAILRTAWQFHQAYTGIFAAVEAEGTIRIGDPIYLREMTTGAE